ncbi:hypothetical protein [Anatilimnocola floriformis]|uniref:hypothetical protein n=1 Tax=Anatilimnocola floriformis TaxID=2948575 RepID=UPI0020C2DA28|nr:hypothetical protein [Anatilimnocola floriformis]
MSLRNWARSFFAPVSSRTRATRRSQNKRSPNQFRPGAESLESRLNMAGNVLATVVGPNLFITGDTESNFLRIEGVTAGTVEVQGVFGTAVNGTLGGEFTARNIQNIFMEMGNGDDSATFVLTKLDGLLRFNGGNGSDALVFGEGNNGQNSFGSLAATMGAGDDGIIVDASETHFSVPGAVVISNGDGANTTYLRATTELKLGPISVTGGANNDDFRITGGSEGTVTTGPLSVIAGDGGNYTALGGNVVVNGGIALVGGNKTDSFDALGESKLTVNGSFIAAMGEDINQVSFNESNVVVTGLVSMTGGAGVDRFIGGTGKFDAFAVSLYLGAGNNPISFFGTTNTIHSTLSVTTLGGFDGFNAKNLDVQGPAVLNMGDEIDLVILNNVRFRGAVSMLLGDGSDGVYIERFSDDGIGSRFDSSVSIDMGAGLDTVELGLDANDFVTFAYLLANGGSGDDSLFNSPSNVFGFAPTFLSF